MVTPASSSAGKRYREANAEHIAEYKKQWRQDNAESIAAHKKRWREANPERHAANSARWSRKTRLKAVGLARARVRAKEWAAANPERVAARSKRYQQEHPDRVRQYQQNYYRRDPEKSKAKTRAWRAANPAKAADLSRKWRAENAEHITRTQHERRADPEYRARELAANRDRRRMQRHLAKAGLPAPKVRRTPIAQRSANEASAAAFFQRADSAEARRRIMESYEPTPAALLQQWRRQSTLAQRRYDTLERFGPAVRRFTERFGGQVFADTLMDSRAREIKGEPALDLEAETRRRIIDTVRREFVSLSYYDALRVTPEELLPSTAPQPTDSTPDAVALARLGFASSPAGATTSLAPIRPARTHADSHEMAAELNRA